MPPTLSFTVRAPASSVVAQAIDLLKGELTARGVTASEARPGEREDLRLEVEPGPGINGYTLADDADGVLRVRGHDANGLLYGIGKLLRTLRWEPFGLGDWRGTARPATAWRGIYVAHNFENWNVASPVGEFIGYLGELALWGINTVAFNFGFGALAGQPERVARYRQVVQAAHEFGLRVGLLFCANCDCPSAPPEALATPFPDADPARRGWDPRFVCPSHPAGRAHLVGWYEQCLGLFAGMPVEFVVSFPYDAGGCGCERCWPWGARGYPTICRELARLARARFPGCQFVLGTWCFDVRDESDSEYEGLDRVLRAEPEPWVDLLMTDAHGRFPRWPLEHGTPGGLPTINFAEISMWGRYPWGGSGANPFPARLQDLWREASHLLDGGLPYSEGRFEDINKHICAGLFWAPQAETAAIVREYAAWYFGEGVAAEVVEAVRLLEANYPSAGLESGRAERAWSILSGVDGRLPERVRNSWRWRILYLRAMIDRETVRSPNIVTALRNEAYEELTRLYCAQRAGGPVAPRAKSFYARPEITVKGPVFAEHIGEQASDAERIR